MALCGMLALGACAASTGPTGGSAGTSTGGRGGPAPTAAQIVAHAKAAPLKDATLTVHVLATANGTTTTIDATDQFTVNPPRESATSTVSSGAATYTGQAIIDPTGYYVKVNGSWVKVPLGAALGSEVLDPRLYLQLQGATLVGTETIDGRPCYHLRGTLPPPTVPGITVKSLTGDVWVRQDTSFPAKFVMHEDADVTAGTTTATTTVWTGTFTAWNIGITIPLPTVG
jgi:hypothetical protein